MEYVTYIMGDYPHGDRIYSNIHHSLTAATSEIDNVIDEYTEAARKHPDLADGLIGFRMMAEARCFWGKNEVIRVYERAVT